MTSSKAIIRYSKSTVRVKSERGYFTNRYPIDIIASISCVAGYVLSGPDRITCLSPGRWSSTQFDCEANPGKIFDIKDLY